MIIYIHIYLCYMLVILGLYSAMMVAYTGNEGPTIELSPMRPTCT